MPVTACLTISSSLDIIGKPVSYNGCRTSMGKGARPVMKETKYILYLGATIGLAVYAVPRLEVGQGWTLPTIFAIAWIAMALLLVSAHLYRVLRVDEETRKEFRRIQLYRRMQMEKTLRKIVRG